MILPTLHIKSVHHIVINKATGNIKQEGRQNQKSLNSFSPKEAEPSSSNSVTWSSFSKT